MYYERLIHNVVITLIIKRERKIILPELHYFKER